jgi:hypothetical protein
MEDNCINMEDDRIDTGYIVTLAVGSAACQHPEQLLPPRPQFRQGLMLCHVMKRVFDPRFIECKGESWRGRNSL